MKRQANSPHDEVQNFAAEGGVERKYSLNAESKNHAESNYVQLIEPPVTNVSNILTALGINEEVSCMDPFLQVLLAKELSCSRYFRWAYADNFIEKILQSLLLNKQDISQEEINFWGSMMRQAPSGRSLLLHHTYGLRKMYATRGFALTAQMIINQAVSISIICFLGYRLYEQFTIASSDFLEFTKIFQSNSKKGISSLVNVLAQVEAEWLYVLLTSPLIFGALKGLWDIQKSQRLTASAIVEVEESVRQNAQELFKKLNVWKDIIRQLITIPGFSSVSECIQTAEQQIRWDGRIADEERTKLFSSIEKLALDGNGMSQLNAMQSLAKIVHSLSIKDFKHLQNAGYTKDTLVQILKIKKHALHALNQLSTSRNQPAGSKNSKFATVSRLYAAYLLWWLGVGNSRHSRFFWPFKLGKAALEGLFLITLVESILEGIQCPDKKGFNISTGEYPVWADQLTPGCFNEFVKQFRLISKSEPFQPFLEQLKNFDLRFIDTLDLSNKALTSNETSQLLNILCQRAFSIKILLLSSNDINETKELLFPNNLQLLDLRGNNIGDAGAQELKLPDSLQLLDLSSNSIGDLGAQGLTLPDSLLSLRLSFNNISDVGAQGLKLPDSLQSLGLIGNNIDDAGVQGLKLPEGLESLDLSSNSIGDLGAQGLKLPDSLQSLSLSGNNIGDAGAQGLKLPDSLQSLDLSVNNIGDSGVQGLKIPGKLKHLSLSYNHISNIGVQRLKFPDSLQSLGLNGNNIGDAGAQELMLPGGLQSLVLSGSNIGDAGAQGLKLPDSLQSLSLSGNNIGDAGIQGLKLPNNLQFLDVRHNNISGTGVQDLKLPNNLQLLDVSSNNISDVSRFKLPDSLQSLLLQDNNIGDTGMQGLQLPDSLEFLFLSSNNISPEGIQRLKLPNNLHSLSLGNNDIGSVGAQRLKLPTKLQVLDLFRNNMSDAGIQELKFPNSLKLLMLSDNGISAKGLQELKFPVGLEYLDLMSNDIGDAGAQALEIPAKLRSLNLMWNNITDDGVNALLKKIPWTNLTNIDLRYNPYNDTLVRPERVTQQQILLRSCRDNLCHANTPLWAQQQEYQTSSATKVQPPLFFSWLKKPFDTLSEYANDCISETLNNVGERLKKVLSRSPSYFPNIHTPEIKDWQSPGSVMLHQFNTYQSSTLLLPATQNAIQTLLRATAQ